MKETFLSQILANLDDPEGYQVYSDWLTEQGDPRGEFIRVQMQLQNGSPDESQRSNLEKLEKELLKQHATTWIEDYASIEKPYEYIDDAKVDFVWGFPAKLSVSHLDHKSAKLIASAGVSQFIRELEIHGLESAYDISEVAEGEHPSALGEFLDSENFRNLRKFELGDVDFDQEYFNCEVWVIGLTDFLRKFDQLEEVRVAARGADAPAIFDLPLHNLRLLHLMHEHNYPVTQLAKNPSMANLEELSIYPHALEYGDEPYLTLSDLRAVCESPHLKKLKHLCFRLTDMGDEAANAIVDSDILDHLETLDLGNGSLKDAGAATLAGSPKISNLRRINLDRNALTETGIEALKGTGVTLSASGQHAGNADDDHWLYEGDIE